MLDTTRLELAARVLESAIQDKMIPGAVAAVGYANQMVWRYAGGMALERGGTPRQMTVDTVFDVASLTKVMATLPSILWLAQKGEVALSDPVGRYLQGFEGDGFDEVTLYRLLTHSAGLIPHRPFYERLRGPEAYLEAIRLEPLSWSPGTHVAYSDFGFILLGEVVRAVTGKSLAQFTEEVLYRPLEMRTAGYAPLAEELTDIAATELIDGEARVGRVHDENGDAMGGVAGHAGLFASVHDVARYVMSWTSEDGSPLAPWVRQASLRLATAGLNGRRGLGWVLPGDGYDVSGDFWPPTTVGHTGFTGTSIQFDPISGMYAVLLTNRVHFGRGTNINGLRRRFHNAVASAWTGA